jgi:hypothetical protein
MISSSIASYKGLIQFTPEEASMEIDQSQLLKKKAQFSFARQAQASDRYSGNQVRTLRARVSSELRTESFTTSLMEGSQPA